MKGRKHLGLIATFLIVVFSSSLNAPASYTPTHNSIIKLEIEHPDLTRALVLLDRHPEYKMYVEDRIKVIKRGRLTSIDTHKATIEITDTFLRRQSVEWIASTLVHEAVHQQQRVDAYKRGYWTGSDQDRELEAMYVQAHALHFFGGRKIGVVDLLNKNGLHFDTNNNGILDAEDDWGY